MIRLLKFLVNLPNEPIIRKIKSQLTRSGASIGANYFEAEAASSKKDYQNYFFIALKSANELKFWIMVLKDGGFISKYFENENQYLLNELKENRQHSWCQYFDNERKKVIFNFFV